MLLPFLQIIILSASLVHGQAGAQQFVSFSPRKESPSNQCVDRQEQLQLSHNHFADAAISSHYTDVLHRDRSIPDVSSVHSYGDISLSYRFALCNVDCTSGNKWGGNEHDCGDDCEEERGGSLPSAFRSCCGSSDGDGFDCCHVKYRMRGLRRPRGRWD